MSSLLEESHPVPSHSQPTSQPNVPNGPLPSPIHSFQLRRLVCDTPTELLVQTFDDRIFVVITQNGKVGCLTQASLPPFVPLPPPRSAPALTHSSDPSTPSSSTTILPSIPPPPPGLALTPLLGSPPSQGLHDLYISQIATMIWWAMQEAGTARRGVVVGLALSRGPRGGGAGAGAGAGDGAGAGANVGGGGGSGVGGVSVGADVEEDDESLSPLERERFAGILGMVAEWVVPS